MDSSAVTAFFRALGKTMKKEEQVGFCAVLADMLYYDNLYNSSERARDVGAPRRRRLPAARPRDSRWSTSSRSCSSRISWCAKSSHLASLDTCQSLVTSPSR